MPTLGELMPGGGAVYRPQVQDRWGRSPNHPDYGMPPGGWTGPTLDQPIDEGQIIGGPPVQPVPVGNDVRRRELPTPDAGWAHPAEAFAPDASIMAPRLMGTNGAFTLYEHGNQRPLQPDEVASAQGYVGDFWRQFPTGFQPGVGPQTNAEYGGGVPTFNPQWTTMGGTAQPRGGMLGIGLGARNNPGGPEYNVFVNSPNFRPDSAPYARYTSGGLMPGVGRGIGMAAGRGWGPAAFAAGGALGGLFGGGARGGQAIANRWRGGGTLGSLSSYAPPSDEDAVQVP